MQKQEYDSFESKDDSNSEEILQEKTYIQKEFIINLDSYIDDPNEYRKVFYILKKARSCDIIRVVLNTYGGSVDTTKQLYNYLLETKAKTIAEIHTAYSGGSVIALCCDEIEVKRFASMMIHSISWGAEGKSEEIIAHAGYIDKLNKTLCQTIYKSFLTDKEIEDVIKGQDLWFDETQILKRLKKWKSIRNSIYEDK